MRKFNSKLLLSLSFIVALDSCQKEVSYATNNGTGNTSNTGSIGNINNIMGIPGFLFSGKCRLINR